MAAKKSKVNAKATSDVNAKYGPLRGTEWLELDHCAFQEFPRKAYALFHEITKYHKVPLSDWLARVENNQSPSAL